MSDVPSIKIAHSQQFTDGKNSYGYPGRPIIACTLPVTAELSQPSFLSPQWLPAVRQKSTRLLFASTMWMW